MQLSLITKGDKVNNYPDVFVRRLCISGIGDEYVTVEHEPRDAITPANDADYMDITKVKRDEDIPLKDILFIEVTDDYEEMLLLMTKVLNELHLEFSYKNKEPRAIAVHSRVMIKVLDRFKEKLSKKKY